MKLVGSIGNSNNIVDHVWSLKMKGELSLEMTAQLGVEVHVNNPNTEEAEVADT